MKKFIDAKKVINASLFNIAWLVCVIFGDLAAVMACTMVLLLHFLLVSRNPAEGSLLLKVVILGWLVDTALFSANLLISDVGSIFPPLWLSCLWLLFATTLNHCFVWFQQHKIVAIIVGAIAGPSSYFAGCQLSAIAIGEPPFTSLLIIALVWAVIFPVVLSWANRLNDQSQSAAS